MSMTHRFATAAAVAVLLLGGCRDSNVTETAAKPSTAGSTSGVFASEPIADGATLPGIGTVKKSAQAGETVRFVARVGGRAACFVPSAAVFVVADPILEDCIQKGDGCPKPWDYCCEPKERLRDNTATVRLVDADGNPLAGSAEGLGGLEPLRTIEVAGVVRETGPDGLFVVDAQRIHVVAN